MAEWKRVKIGSLCSIRRGASPRPIHAFIQPSEKGGIPWVKIADATSTDSRFISSTRESIIEDGVAHSLCVAPGDLVLSNSATPGLPRFMKIAACIHDGWLLLRDFKGVDKFFLYYQFNHIRAGLLNRANGSVFNNLKTDIVRDFEVSLPPLPTQRKIAAVLGALDDKIENNRKICANLEAQAQALFKSWFVDFEPFGGKMPSGWKMGKLGDVAEITSGKRPPSRCDVEDAINRFPLLGASAIMGFTKEFMYDEPILVTGRVGTHGVIQRSNEKCWPSDNTLVVKTNRYEFVYQFMKTVDYHRLNRGSTQPLITQSDIKELSMIVPTDIWLDKYEEKAATLMTLWLIRCRESRALAATRDALLPKLMSGEIDVEKVEV